MDSNMQLTLNGEPRDVPDGATITALLTTLGLTPRHVAVEVNEQLVKRDRFDATALAAGDRVEIVTLVGGG
jgi:thiamine biosynthesis protein ThiS